MRSAAPLATQAQYCSKCRFVSLELSASTGVPMHDFVVLATNVSRSCPVSNSAELNSLVPITLAAHRSAIAVLRSLNIFASLEKNRCDKLGAFYSMNWNLQLMR